MAAEVEETVVDADAGGLQTEDVGDDRAQSFLVRGARGAGGLGGCGRVGQGRAVGLAAGGARESGERHDDGRDHVRGERAGQVFAQAVGGGITHDVGHQPLLTAPVLTHSHRGLGDGRVRREHGLDLAEFDAEAADLHLVVGASDEPQPSVTAADREVPGPVHPLPRRPEGVGDEPLGGECRAPEVAAGGAAATEMDLADDPVGDRPQGLVQEVDPVAGERVTERR